MKTMEESRKSRVKCGASAIRRRKRKVIPLEDKFEIINRFENGDKKSKIGRDFGINESTIRTILKKADDYKSKGKIASKNVNGGTRTTTTTSYQSERMMEMESLLTTWIEDCNARRVPPCYGTIKTKALALYTDVKRNDGFAAKTRETFTASNGWLSRFKNRTGITILANPVHPTITTTATAIIKEEIPYDHSEMMGLEDNFLQEQFLPSVTMSEEEEEERQEEEEEEVDDDSMPSTTTFSAANIKCEPELNVTKDRLLLLLRGDNVKLKPTLIYRSRNLSPLDDHDQNLPDQLTSVIDEIASLGREFGLNDIDTSGVRRLLVDDSRQSDTADDEREMNLMEFDRIFELVETLKQQLTRVDPNVERRSKVVRNLETTVDVYRRLYREKKREKLVQTSILKYFPKSNS